jgi:short subunit dehydrogenase-like uncharacterized protein
MDTTDAKTPNKFGFVPFVASIVVTLPIYVTVLLPFTVLSCTIHFLYYNLGKLFFISNAVNDATTTATTTTTATATTNAIMEKIQNNNTNDENDNNNDDIMNGEETIVNIIPREKRKYDLILFGASGYVGKLAVSYLVKEYGVVNDSNNNNNSSSNSNDYKQQQQQQQQVKWAIAGRSELKLKSTLLEIAQELGCFIDNEDFMLNHVDVIIADTSDPSTLKRLVENTRCIASTVGPFQKYGSPLVEFCAKYGTHYADITGEVPWNKEMMRLYEHSAQHTGAKIVSFCGHDSIPWDVTVRYLSNKLREDCNDELRQVECLNELVGGVSGGTLATVFESIDRTVKDFQWDSLSKIIMDDTLDMYQRLPCGAESENKIVSDLPWTIGKCRNPSQRFATKWCGPFFMAAINMEVAGRSVALSKGTKQIVKYREAIVAENMMDAFVAWWGTILFGTAAINPVLLPILKKFLPSPGEGPTESVLNDGFLCVTGHGIGKNGNEVESVFYFPHDGGYKSTARMLVESSICLALDEDRHESSSGGFYSPASLMCDALLDRLVKTGSSFACNVVSKSK